MGLGKKCTQVFTGIRDKYIHEVLYLVIVNVNVTIYTYIYIICITGSFVFYCSYFRLSFYGQLLEQLFWIAVEAAGTS